MKIQLIQRLKRHLNHAVSQCFLISWREHTTNKTTISDLLHFHNLSPITPRQNEALLQQQLFKLDLIRIKKKKSCRALITDCCRISNGSSN